MGERGAEVGVPGVQVRVEVQHRDLAVVAGQRPQDRQRDGVVAAQGEQRRPVGPDVGDGGVDLLDRLGEVERVDRDVTGVGHLLDAERVHVLRRVVRPQQLRRVADVPGTEPGARPVADAGVERHAQDRDVRAGHLVDPRQPGEGGRPGVAGDAGGVGRADDRRLAGC